MALGTFVAVAILAHVALGQSDEVEELCPKVLVGTDDGYLTTYEGRCFYFHQGSVLNYERARAVCKVTGGNLAMPKTEAINQFLSYTRQNIGRSTQDWIGLQDIKNEGTFVWEDGTFLRQPDFYENFDDNNGLKRHGLFRRLNFEDCVSLDSKTMKWHDFGCKDSIRAGFVDRFFICEYPADVNTVVKGSDDVSGDDVSGDDVSGDDVSGDAVTGR